MSTTPSNAVVIISGGMDSTVLAYSLARTYKLHLISFNYGQRHKKELSYAAVTARKLGARHDIIDLKAITPLLHGSSLTDNIDVPEGHYAEENMKATVVPNRNAIMLSIAYAAAVADHAAIVATAVHAGDHPIYPDCRPEFIASLDEALSLGNEGYADPTITILAPYAQNTTKAQIATLGHSLGVPFEDTWSCYKGGEEHCGTCGTCVERIEAFRIASVPDPTVYTEEGMKKYQELVAAGTVQ